MPPTTNFIRTHAPVAGQSITNPYASPATITLRQTVPPNRERSHRRETAKTPATVRQASGKESEHTESIEKSCRRECLQKADRDIIYLIVDIRQIQKAPGPARFTPRMMDEILGDKPSFASIFCSKFSPYTVSSLTPIRSLQKVLC